MSKTGTKRSLRKALGAIKDNTTVNLAKINSDYKELDINIVKVTNHVEVPAKEVHIQAIFAAISAARPRADVIYCIHALARRLSKTHNWTVALKTLMFIHRALREVDSTFQEQLVIYGRTTHNMLNLSHFRDHLTPSGTSKACYYSAWVQTYASYLEARLECFRVLKYDVETDHPRTKDLDTPDLLEQLPVLQQLLYRVLSCQPRIAPYLNFVVLSSLRMIASESVKIYNAISDGINNLVDKFFEMQRHDALKALEIYRRVPLQVERLSEFHKICKYFDVGCGDEFKIEQPPSSFLQAMEEYVREVSDASTVCRDLHAVDDKPKEISSIEDKQEAELKEKHARSAPAPEPEPEPEAEAEPEPVKVKVKAPIAEEPPDLLSLNDTIPEASELDQKNAMALAVVPIVDQPDSTPTTSINGTTGWELALVTTTSSNETATASSKLAGGLDKLTLDSLYDDAIRRTSPNMGHNPWGQQGPMMAPLTAPDPFYVSNVMAAPHAVQMAAMAQQQRAYMLQQQQQMMIMSQPLPQQGSNPFVNSYGPSPYPYGSGVPSQGYNPYYSLF